MASPTHHQEAFKSLRPYCVQLTVEQTVQNVKSLRSQISATEESALQDLLEYILFPLRFTLKTAGVKKTGLVEAVLECISYLLSLTSLKSPGTLREIFSELWCCLPTDQFQSVSEELKLAVVCSARSLLRSSCAEALPVLYKPAMLPELGFTITLLLKLAEHEKSREIRLEALGCLEDLLFQDIKQETEQAALFASFLPGVCTVLTRIICGDPKQGYKVMTCAITIWAGIVSMVMSGKSLAHVPAKKPKIPGLSGRVSELMVNRDKDWVKHTASQLLIHLDKITACCTSNPHWKVRLALVELAHLMLSQCSDSLQEAAGNLLRILVSHMSDERPEVKSKGRKVLLEVAKEGPASRALKDVLSESLHSLATTLPRLLNSQDDQGKLHTLALLLGYLQLLGPQLTITLHSPAHLKRLSAAILQTLELDLCSVKVVEARLPSSSPHLNHQDPKAIRAQQKHFNFFRDPCVLSHIESVCRLLGYYGDLCLLTDHFLGWYRAQSLPAVLVLNQLVLGAAGLEVEVLDGISQALDESELLDTVRSLLEEYLDPANWHLNTCHNSSDLGDQFTLLSLGSTAKSTLSDMSTNAWKLFLQLEGISCFARALGMSFRPLLITALYPLLEKAGDPSLMVSGAAILALEDVSQACGYQDISQLIEGNADYLASEVSAGLRRLQRRQGGAARVLHAMLENCGPGILPLLGELVQDLLPALDQAQDEGTRILLPVLHSLVSQLGQWYPQVDITVTPELPSDVSSHALDHSGSLALEIQDFLRDHIKLQRIAQGEVQEETEDVPLTPHPQASDDEPPLPTYIQISKEIAEKCTHFLSHSDPHIRMQALDTLKISLLTLQSQENVLLPLAHRIWPCLVKRLLKDEPLVLLRAFQVLMSLAVSCRDFLRQRVCKDALPAFLKSLRSQASVSVRAGPVYTHTLGFKLQLAVLNGLGTLCLTLGLGDGDLLEVIDSCALYLSARQPKKLQETAISTFLQLAELDPDAVWLYLCEWTSPPAVPHPSLRPMPWTGRAHDEFTHNVCSLLQMLK
ncbi:TELO2-interacting protein 1 homolog [Rhinophrynus dorsalis]